MSEPETNSRYANIVDAALTFFTILVGLKLADLIDSKGALGEDKWPCFITGVAVFMRYVTGSFNHQKAQYVKRMEHRDRRFSFDLFFLMVFGIMAAWACVADTVPSFLCRLSWFSGIALSWTICDTIIESVANDKKPRHHSKYAGWIGINLVQLIIFGAATILMSPPSTGWTITVWGVGFRYMSILSAVAVLILLADLRLQLGFHPEQHEGRSKSAGVDSD